MNDLTLKRNEQFRLLVRDASRRGDPDTSALAAGLADGSQQLNLSSLGRLTDGILATDDDLLICLLIEYCVSNSIMFQTEHQAGGWRKFWARVKEGLFGDGERKGEDTIS